MPAPQPRSLRELPLWFAGGDELAAKLGTACDVTVLGPADWRERVQGSEPAFLLVEGSGETEARWSDELDHLLSHCEKQTYKLPTLLWFTVSPIEPAWLERCGRFDQVFGAERWQTPTLEAAGAPEPSTLWPATALPIEPGPCEDTNGRADDVVWIGGWRRDWPEAWRERLTSVLRGAAKRGLRIVPVADMDGLPTDLHACVADTEPAVDPLSALRRAKVVIAADAAVGSPTFVPPVAFDAPACGAAVLTPHDFAGIHEFGVGFVVDGSWRNMIPIVHDGDITVAEIDRLLDDERYRSEVVSHLQRIVSHNHTYGQRAATLASAAGYRLLA